MADRGTFTPLHPTTRKYVAGAVREPLPERVRELVERLHDAEPITDPRTRRDAADRRADALARATSRGPHGFGRRGAAGPD